MRGQQPPQMTQEQANQIIDSYFSDVLKLERQIPYEAYYQMIMQILPDVLIKNGFTWTEIRKDNVLISIIE